MILAQYERFTLWVVAHAPGPDKLVHTYAGLAIWLIAVVLLRRGFGSLWPLLCVAMVELPNEFADRLVYGSWRWVDTTGDIAATLVWPLLLFAVARFTPVRKCP